MLGELTPCGGGESIPLVKPALVIGRWTGCDVVLPYPTVSSRHCRLELREGYWIVQDLESRNGIWVNGKRCKERCLAPGDVLWIARYRFRVHYEPPGDRPPPELDEEAGGVAESLVARSGLAQAPGGSPPANEEFNAPVVASLGELVPTGGGDPIPLLKPVLLIGRNVSCDIVIPCQTVSGRHCELEFADGYWTVRDVGSRNGVRVDGEKCLSRRVLPGMLLSLARQHFRLDYKSPEPARSAGEGGLLRRLLGKARPQAREGDAAQAEASRPVIPKWLEDKEPRPRRWSLDENDEG